MGKKNQQKKLQSTVEKEDREELLNTLGDFTSKENWDNFYKIKDAFEWYAEWHELRAPLLSHLPSLDDGSSASLQILVPGCGNSRLSEDLYDAGFKAITNIDFSKVAITEMLRRNVRSRPIMRWRVMDMADMQFADETFDIVLDKGGLDALMEPGKGTVLGSQYLSEVKRVLTSTGKFICLTLAEPNIIGFLFFKFRHGWNVTVYSIRPISQKSMNKFDLYTFMVVVEKDKSAILPQISSRLDDSYLNHNVIQARGLLEVLENENKFRTEYSNSPDLVYAFEDLRLGVKGNLAELNPGQRIKLNLGEPGKSCFCYKAVLLDAQEPSPSFEYVCGVFIVPKSRSHEWLFASEEGQWMIVISSKAARLIMVFLDASHTLGMEDIQIDLSPLVKPLAPGVADAFQIPFLGAGDGIKQRKVIYKVKSPLTGTIVIEDVLYAKNCDKNNLEPTDLVFRRLVFERMENLVQSEALLIKNSAEVLDELNEKKANTSSKTGRKGRQAQNDDQDLNIDDWSNNNNVDLNYLASDYHTGIISGLALICPLLESAASNGRMVKAIVIGLGAGLLPMFLHKTLPCLHIEVVELDIVVYDVAKGFFQFKEDAKLKVHITDGIEFVRELANSGKGEEGKDSSNENNKTDILIVDVDSADLSTGMTCPAADFVEESFLLAAKRSLSEQGLLVINLVSRSPSMKEMVVSRMTKIFKHLFCIQLDEDVNEVLFAINSEEEDVTEDRLEKASARMQELLNIENEEISQTIIEAAQKIKRLH
ncbi:eEF1A lysine and N-terminal methyltransferase [Impatiens glandulifera]|uniref:eEF1A lysine and N-terminal methyltransferase n=1 Tax=Impatiens glandulifera TaxID=253017 RepID=UPI001FB0F2A7|nr:eEF1A lysine and N-terminal methyltransferase [Impatiens glandulifera]